MARADQWTPLDAEAVDARLECSVCLRLLHEPATLACGHSFCRRCLSQCMQRARKCPTCRCDIEAQPAESIALSQALRLLHPREAAERAREEVALPPQLQLAGLRSLPLFVLEPLLPAQTIHLHVFEPRYIRLTQRALTEASLEKRFGMVAISHRGMSPVGVTVRIINWTEVAGGRYFLTVVGERRFRILRTWDVDGYRNAEVAWVNDAEPERVDPPTSVAAENSLADAAAATERAALPRRLMVRECKAAIGEWTAAVMQGWERRTGQLDALLRELGPAPDGDTLEGAEMLGLWCAALINPLPPLGVAPEIRLQALECTDSVERLRLVLVAAESSLQHMRAPRSSLFGGRLFRLLSWRIGALGDYPHAFPFLAVVGVLVLKWAVLESEGANWSWSPESDSVVVEAGSVMEEAARLRPSGLSSMVASMPRRVVMVLARVW